MNRIPRLIATSAAVGLAICAVSAAAAPPAKLALSGGHIIPVAGAEIEEGTILIENGRITAIGADVDIPYDAMEIDVSGQVLMPGLIDPHTWRGMDIANENLSVTPFLDTYDAIDPARAFFEEALREGVTSVHVIAGNDTVIGGLSRVVRPIGLSVDEMTVRPGLALKISASPKRGSDRMAQRFQLREAFLELDDYLETLAEQRYEESRKDAGEPMDVGPAEAKERGRSLIRDRDIDDKHLNLVRMRRGEVAPWIYAGAAMDVAPAIEMARDQGILEQAVLVLGGTAFRAAAGLADAGRPVVLPAELFHRERDPMTGELSETFIPKVLADAGVSFCLQPNPDGSLAERFLTYQAALCVRHGLSREQALEAITLSPARMLSIDEDLGSLEVGKVANILVYSGDPLDFSSWLDKSFINGILAYDRERDHRLQNLLDVETDASPDTADEGGSNGDVQDDGSSNGDAPDDGGSNGDVQDDGSGR